MSDDSAAVGMSLDPDEVRLGMVGDDGNLKPSLVNDTYAGGVASPRL